MEILNISSFSNTVSSNIVILNKALVYPIGNVTLYGPTPPPVLIKGNTYVHMYPNLYKLHRYAYY